MQNGNDGMNGDIIGEGGVNLDNTVKYEENTWITWNRLPGYLWGLKAKDKVEIDTDRTHLKYVNVDSKIKKSSIYEIIFLKYVTALLLAWFIVYDVNMYYPSMMAVWMSILLFVFFKQLYEKVNRTSALLFIVIVPLMYLYYIFHNDFNDDYELGYIVNYMFQYLIAIYIMNVVYIDFLKKGFEGYYTVDSKPFKFIKIYDNEDEINEKIGFSEEMIEKIELWKKRIIVGVFIVTFVISFVGLIHKISNEHRKALVEQHLVDINDIESDKYLEFLDSKAKKVGIRAYHREDEDIFDGIQNYEILEILNGTKYKMVFSSDKNDVDFSEKEFRGKAFKRKVFIKDDWWHFVEGDYEKGNYKVYQFTSVKADEVSSDEVEGR